MMRVITMEVTYLEYQAYLQDDQDGQKDPLAFG